MAFSLKPLAEQVIVITGASSGIGLATAKMAAEKGAKVVLAARNEDALRMITEEMSAKGFQAAYVVADVAVRADVERIAQAAVEQFGGFDTWVNDAGVAVWGMIEDVSEEDNRRLFETNFWGLVNGSLVALKTLKARGGALINLGSVASDMGHALLGMYAASKHAVKGFTDSLRIELEQQNAPVSVTLIKPGSIDTPFPEHAKKYTPNQPNLPAPVYHPDEVARAILYAATTPKRDIYVGSSARTFSALNRVAPRVMDKMAANVMAPQELREQPARNTEGALHSAGSGLRTQGDNPGRTMKRSLYTRATMSPVLTSTAVAAAVGVAAVALLSRRRTQREG